MNDKDKTYFVKLILILVIFIIFLTVFGLMAQFVKNTRVVNPQPQVSPISSPALYSFTGTLISGGVECILFQADDGTFYSLEGAGRIIDVFNDGDRVSIKGNFVEQSYCMQGKKVISLSEIDYAKDETADWKTYRNEKDTKENYKLVEIKIPSGWKANDNIFTTSLKVGSHDPDFKFSFNLDIYNGNEIITAKDEKGNFFEDSLINILKQHEKEYKEINIGDIPVKGMQQEYIDNEGSGAFVINTYLYLEPYVYTFNFLEFASGTDTITSTAKILNDQILSTFKFLN